MLEKTIFLGLAMDKLLRPPQLNLSYVPLSITEAIPIWGITEQKPVTNAAVLQDDVLSRPHDPPLRWTRKVGAYRQSGHALIYSLLAVRYGWGCQDHQSPLSSSRTHTLHIPTSVPASDNPSPQILCHPSTRPYLAARPRQLSKTQSSSV